MQTPALRQALSVLVVIHSPALEVLLLERRSERPGLWQSVTGSVERGELLIEAARREVYEETGITETKALVDWHRSSRFAIYPEFLHRYPPGVFHNSEHVFSLCVERDTSVRLSTTEHTRYRWEAWQSASRLCFSWSNSAIIDELPLRCG